MGNSIFSKIIRREIPAYIIHEDDKFIAFLDINPVQLGHTLVIPKNQIDYIFDINDEDLSSMMIFAKKVARGIKLAVNCKRVGIAVLGFEVPHAHIHLVPLNQTSDMDFHNIQKVSHEQLIQIATEIKKYLDE